MAIHKAINYKILGDDTLRELPTTRSWTPNDGISTDHHFVGPREAVQEYFNEISALGSNASIDEMSEEFNGNRESCYAGFSTIAVARRGEIRRH